MKLLLLFAFVHGVFSYFNYPDFNPSAVYLDGDPNDPTNKYFQKACRRQYVPDGQGNFTEFIEFSSLIHSTPRYPTRKLSSVICYQGTPAFLLALTANAESPKDGDTFIAANLSSYDNEDRVYYSEIFYQSFNNACVAIITPPFFNRLYPNCIFLELEDFYSSNGGRVAISSLGQYPVTLNCFDVPAGLISDLNYLSLTTDDNEKKGGFFWYDCARRDIPRGVYGTRPGIRIDVEQDQIVVQS